MNYWKQRQGFKYYREIERMLEEDRGDSILDVGSNNTPVVGYGDFSFRHAINLDPIPESERVPDALYTFTDFLEYNTFNKYDTVICLQVLEHLDDDTVSMFAKKLFEHSSNKVIISIPYMWKVGQCDEHLQDPAGWDELYEWTNRVPDSSIIVHDNLPRLICTYYNKTTYTA